MQHLPIALAACALAAPLHAQLQFDVLADLNTQPVPLSAFYEVQVSIEGYTVTPYPENLYWQFHQTGIEAGGRSYFFARTQAEGDELWVSDGTPLGTQLLKDIRPGQASAYPRSFVELDGRVYFAANDGVHGRELWVTDGTPAGTQMVADTFAGPLGLLDDVGLLGTFGEVERIVELGGTLYFRGRQVGTGGELWRSDGTAAGTQLVKDIRPGAADGTPHALTATSLGLLFGANDGTTGFEPYISDGTAAGTQRLLDIYPGTTAGFIGGFVEVNGTALFSARINGLGADLWRTDGTSAGTFKLDVAALGDGSSPFITKAEVLGGYAYFHADGVNSGIELFRSDGTAANTELVADLRTGPQSSYPSNFSPAGNQLTFVALSDTGSQLFSVDSLGTVTALSDRARTGGPLSHGGFTYYSVAAPGGLTQVLRTDGTIPGTTYLSMPAGVHAEGWYTPLPGGQVMFAGDSAALAREPYVTGPTATDAQFLTEINTGVATAGAAAHNLRVVGPRTLYFAASDGIAGNSVYRWDPAQGAQLLSAPPALPPSEVNKNPIGHFTPLWSGGQLRVLFSAGPSWLANELWVTDGTPLGTNVLVNAQAVPGFDAVAELTASGERLFFTARVDPLAERKLFVTDGTVSGTVQVPTYLDNGLPVALTEPALLTPYKGGVVMADGNGDVLWSDGTPAGTKRIYTATADFDQPQGFYVARDQVAFFVKRSIPSTFEWQVHAADLSGSTLLASFNSATNGWVAPHFGHIGPDLYFFARKQKIVSIYRTDLTPSGTVVVATKNNIPQPIAARSLHLGTIPVVLFLLEDGTTAAFNGQIWTPLAAQGIPDLPYTLDVEGPTVVFAGGGYFDLSSAFGNGAQLIFGDFTAPALPVWSAEDLGALDTTPAIIRDLHIVAGRLVTVFDDKLGAGEEIHATAFQSAYVQDLDVTGNGFRIEASDPIMGGPVRVSGLGAPAGTPTMLFAGGVLDTPLATGMAPTTPLWLSPVGMLPVTAQVGSAWTHVTSAPNSPSLIGKPLCLQAGYIDAQSGLIHASNALVIGLGL